MTPTAYGLFAAAACATAVLWLKRHRAGMGLSENEFWAAIWTLLAGAVVGAKALFVALGFEHYARGELRLWADFRVGFVFFGGLLGAAAAGGLFARLRRLDFARGADYFAVALPMGHAVGRIGCWFAGCCPGRPPHPVPLYEAALLALVAWLCRGALAQVEAGARQRGSAFRLYLASYGILRLLLDPLRADGRLERLLGLSHQQGLALLLLGVAVAWHAAARRAAPRRGAVPRLRPWVAALPTLLALGPAAARAQEAFDHAAFDGLLRAHVADGLVDYDAFAAAPAFAGYLRSLAAFDPATLPTPARLALWINAYNAYTIELINRHGERESIRNINREIFGIRGYGPWKERLAVVGGRAYGLDHLEQKIIRPEFQEPRIHFALVCAAMGCPPLRSEAYTGARLEEQLEDQARRFLRHSPDKNRVDVAQRAVYVSELFRFRDYEQDFGGSRRSLAIFIARYYPPGAERDLLESGRWERWEYTDYDWTLNSQERARRRRRSRPPRPIQSTSLPRAILAASSPAGPARVQRELGARPAGVRRESGAREARMGDFTMTIGGTSVPAAESFGVVNPATGEVFARAPECSRAQLDAAMEAAARAFPAWSRGEARRREALGACAAAVRARAGELAPLLTQEQGKPLAHASDEISRAALWFEYTAALQIPVELLADDERLRVEVHRRPCGVVGAITPWNYPVALAVWKIAPALLAGNTVVLKPSPFTPLATLALGEALRETLPPGVLNVVSGGDELGAWITSHPRVRKISFTGSIETGKKVAAAAAPDLKRLTLELGGNDAAIVLDDVDPRRVAEKLFWGAFTNSGQVCSAIKRLYVPERLERAFVEELAEVARSVKLGDGLDPASQLGPVNNRPQFERVIGLVEDAKRHGGRAAIGGAPLARSGYFYPPTLVTGLAEGVRLVDEEQFGPALPILTYRDLEEAVERANRTRYGLSGSVWSADPERAAEVAGRLECGTAWVNQHLAILPNAPFGGAKWSGLGVENGPWGLLGFTEIQTLHIAKQ
jgi:acyl-CoA reductase-like NAD-dependent aldehyde dehydrogenase/prolipoprotein diacylglyceryltransferase